MRAIAVGIACLAGVFAAAQGRPQHVGENYTMPVSISAFNDCTGETVEFEGNVHVQYRAHEHPQGFRAEATSNYQNVRGTGTASGATYRLVGTHTSEVDFRRPYPSHSMLNLSVRMLRNGGGKGSNAHVHLQVRYTASGDGKVSSSIERATITCR